MVDSTISRRATERSPLRSTVLMPFSRKASMTFQMSTRCTGERTGKLDIEILPVGIRSRVNGVHAASHSQLHFFCTNLSLQAVLYVDSRMESKS